MFLAPIGQVLLFKKCSLGDLSKNLSAEFWFIKIMAVVTIVGVVTDFETTFSKLLDKIMILFLKLE